MKLDYVNIYVRWDHGFEYTLKMVIPSNERINSYAKHLNNIRQVEYFKITSSKNKLILDKKTYVPPIKLI